jgi:malonyl CoA-acyl carrier protein transacylase
MACVLRVCFACVLFQGMDRYEANPSVKAVWDAADDYLMSQYGFSIIDIVRRNPKVRKRRFLSHLYIKMHYFTKTGSGQT